jgi:hypothetical protein
MIEESTLQILFELMVKWEVKPSLLFSGTITFSYSFEARLFSFYLFNLAFFNFIQIAINLIYYIKKISSPFVKLVKSY